MSGCAWAIGTSLAALAGILLTPVIGLQYYDLTLLVISAYAAAMLGKLTSLPMTYVGAMGLGIIQSYAVGYLPSAGDIAGLRAVIPTLFLFVDPRAAAAGAAADRPGQGHRVRRRSRLRQGRPLGRRAGASSSMVLALRAGRLRPAAGRHRGDVRAS